MDSKTLKAKRAEINKNVDITVDNLGKLADESNRVADVAHNSESILKDLDQEFEAETGLQGNDIKFLFASVALQVIRIAIINNLTKIESAGIGNRNETALHNFQENLLSKFDNGGSVVDKPYYASMEHIISRTGVPYDATATLTEKSIESLMGKGRTWDVDLDKLIPTEKVELFKGTNNSKGANHRFSTLGHDPLLGLVFGTGNIMTNTITCVNKPVIGESLGLDIPVLTTNHVVYTSDYKDPRIATYGSTVAMIKNSVDRTIEQPSALIASLIKQIIHIGTDLYTPCGIQIPGANLVLSKSEAEKLTQYISTGDIVKVGASAGAAVFINYLISTLHTLMYDTSMPVSRDVYSVRTRKIIMYSNLIASGSNVILTSINMALGNEGAIRQIDLGGLIVTIHRLVSDSQYIRQIKEEFVLGSFKNMIQGDDLDLKKTTWEGEEP